MTFREYANTFYHYALSRIPGWGWFFRYHPGLLFWRCIQVKSATMETCSALALLFFGVRCSFGTLPEGVQLNLINITPQALQTVGASVLLVGIVQLISLLHWSSQRFRQATSLGSFLTWMVLTTVFLNNFQVSPLVSALFPPFAICSLFSYLSLCRLPANGGGIAIV